MKRIGSVFGLLIVLLTAAISSSQENKPQEDGTSPERQKEIERYLDQLKSASASERSTAANQLGHLGAKSAIPGLRKCLTDENNEVKYFSLGALIELGDAEVVIEARKFLDHSSQNLVIMAVQALLTFEDKESLPKVLALLRHHSPYIRMHILLALGFAGIKAAASDVKDLLSDENRQVRYNALTTLGAVGGSQHTDAVEKFLDDPDVEFRVAAVSALGTMDPLKYRDKLRGYLNDKSPQIRLSAARALARIQDKWALKVIQDSGMHVLLNYYHSPKTIIRIQGTVVPVHEIRWMSVGDILAHFSKKTEVPITVSPKVNNRIKTARFGPNIGFLGTRVSAIGILGSLNGYFLKGVPIRTSLTFILQDDSAQVVTAEEAEDFWKKYLKTIDVSINNKPARTKSVESDREKQEKAINEIQEISKTIKLFYLEKSRLPNSLEEIVKYFNGGKVLMDPWGSKYIYVKQSRRCFDLISLGADGKKGGSGVNRDLNRESRRLRKDKR